MRSRLLIILLVLFLENVCLAQYDSTNYEEKKFAFGWNIGNGYPKRDFFSADQSHLPMSKFTGQDTNKINGYALKGFHWDVFVTYKLYRHISIILEVNGDKNSYDFNTLNQQFTTLFPHDSVSVTTTDEYYVTQYLLGTKINLPISEHTSFEFKVLAGITTVSNPNITYSGPSLTQIYSYSDGSGFGYNIGAGVKYSIETEGDLGFALHMNIGYAGSNIKYPGYGLAIFNTSSGNYIGSSSYNISKTMALGILQVTIGATLEL